LAASRFKIAEAFAAVGLLLRSWFQHEFKNPFIAGPQFSSTFGLPPLITTFSWCIFWEYPEKGLVQLSISHSIIANEYISQEYPYGLLAHTSGAMLTVGGRREREITNNGQTKYLCIVYLIMI